MRTLRWAFALGLVLLVGGVSFADEAGVKPLKVVMYSGSAEYNSAESLAGFKKHLEEQYGAVCSLHVVDEKGTTLKGIDELETCDVAVIFTRRLKLDEGQVARLKKYCDAGKPIVGIRTASHAFQTWLEFDKDVIGGNYKGHYKENEPAEVKLAQGNHPVLNGVSTFPTLGKLYKNPDIAEDVTRLLVATTGEASEPVAWVRTHRGGRVFYTSLGVPEDFKRSDFRRLLVNAVYWTAKRETPKPRE